MDFWQIFYSRIATHSLILVLLLSAIGIDVASAQVTLQNFRQCIVDNGLPPNLVEHHSTGNTSLYAELDHRWNVRPLHVHPLAYFVPRFTTDVQVGVRCARANNIPVIPKSGGHSAELLSFGNENTIVIAFQNMKKIQINALEKTAVIESGALLGEIRETLLSEDFGLSTGDCADVGIAGIALGGGDGRTTAIYNLTVDNILEMEVVDPNGELYLVNENVNSDLFWALRGIGQGYIGIVTSFKFQIFNATDVNTTRLDLLYDLEIAGSVLLAYQNYLIWAENEGFHVRASINVRGAINQMQVILQLLEEKSNGQPTNAELIANKAYEMFPPIESQMVTLTFPSYRELRGVEENEFLSVNANPGLFVKKKSFFVNRTLSAEEYEIVGRVISKARNLPILTIFFGHTGAYNKIPPTDMSYVHRGHLYLVSPRVNANAQESDEVLQLAFNWLDEFDTESKIMDSGASYQNYVDLDLSDNFMERYYGINAQRLMEIKRKWDPDNYFQNEMSIPIANMAAKSLIMLPTSVLCLCLIIVLKELLKLD